MKKVLAIFLTAVLLLSVTACRTDNPEPTMKDPDEWSVQTSQTHSDYEGIEVQIANAAWGENGFVLKVDWINRTSYEGIFGALYVIEKREGEQWVSCATVDDLVFDALAYVLAPGQTREETYQVSQIFDVSAAGTYRFRSEITVNDGTEEANKCSVWAEFSLEYHQDEIQSKTEEAVEYGVQYVRTDGYQDGARFPKVKIIRSTEELNSYYKTNKETFNLERSDFLDACDKYDGAYFEKGYLVLVLIEEGSGSIHHEVTGSTISSDGELGIYISRIVPEFGTCDMAEWHIILEMSNAVEVKDENNILVYLDGRLSFDKGEVVTQEIGTQAPVILKEPPDAQLLHGSGSAHLPASGYSWTYPNEDGTMGAIIADSLHPLDCKDILDPIYVMNDYVKLGFEDEPDSVAVKCWPDSQWGNTSAVSEEVTCYGGAFDLKHGGYIYEITAKWDQNDLKHFGSASYYVYIVLGEEHTHQTASEPQTVADPISGYCGNTQTTVYIDGEAYTFMYDHSVTLTDILVNLAYDPNKICRCRPEYTVDTEFGKGYGINLTAGYARCEKGQADLTKEQTEQIWTIIEWVKTEKPGK